MKILSLFPTIYYKESINSTSTFLKENYKKYHNLTFVSASFQTNGRGRNERTWISDNNANLLFSFLIKKDKYVKKFDTLSIFIGVSILLILKNLGIKNVELKWPNDIYINGKKVCGILLDGVTKNGKLDSVIIGIGLNVNQTNFQNDLRIPPTSLKLETNLDYDLNKFRKKFIKKIYFYFKNIEKIDYLKIANENNFLKNKVVSAEINSKIDSYLVGDILSDNSLELIKDNKVISVKTGEVNLIK